jgi:ERCC4-type nuclease
MSSIISIQYYKGFSVYRTQTILESAMYIVYFADKLQREIVKKQKTPFYINHINYNINNNINNNTHGINIHNDELNHIDHINDVKNDTVSDKPNNTTNHNHHTDHYSQVIKKVKKDNITIDNIGEIILSQIPNVSSQSAISIMNKFKTIKQLIHHLEKDDKCLDDIFIGTDKPRKLNKNCKSSIYKYLLQRDIEIIIN